MAQIANTADSYASRLVSAVSWCATIVAICQLLLAVLLAWVFVDLHLFGTPVTRFAFVFAAAFVAVQMAVLLFAWNLPRDPRVSLWFLAAACSLGLAILALIGLSNINPKTWILQPGAILPPNEIMGRDWPLAVAMIAFGLAQLLGIVPLMLVALVWARRNR